jgi:hypothetical protein
MKNSILVLFLLCITVVSNAQVANQPADLLVCDDDGTGFAVFNITITEPEILGTQDPSDFVILFYTSQSDADNGTNPIVNPSNFLNSVNPQTIFARLEALSNGSFDTTNFDLIVVEVPILFTPNSLELCDDDIVGTTTDGYSTFDLTSSVDEITGGDPTLFVLFYGSQSDQSNDIQIAAPSSYVNIVNPQAIYISVINALGCESRTTLDLIVIPNPFPSTPTPLEVCDDNGDGFAAFTLTDKDDEISNGEPDVSVRYFETLLDALDGFPGVSLVSPYTNVVGFTQTIYVRVESQVTACFTIVELELRVLDGCPTIATAPTNIFKNEGDNDGSAIFDLTLDEGQMLGAQDPTIYLFSYHETFENSMDGIDPIVTPIAYQNILNPQTIYVRLTNNGNGSYALIDFEIETDGVLGINENSLNNLQLYPNPVSENLIIQSQFLTSDSSVIIYNLQGQKLFSELVLPVNGKIILTVSEMNSGMYIVKLTSEGNTITRKLIKN